MNTLKRTILSLLALTILQGRSTEAAEPQRMITETTAKTLAEFRRTNDASVFVGVLPELNAVAASRSNSKESTDALFRAFGDIGNTLYGVVDRNFDLSKLPGMNSGSPGGQYSSGTDPKSVKDSELRAEYEKRIAKDRQYAQHYTEQHNIMRAIDALTSAVRQNSRGMSETTLREALLRGGLTPTYCDELLRRMKAAPQ